MSFFLEQDEDKNPGLASPSAPSAQSAISSGQGAQTPPPINSGAFTDIRKYLDANQGASESMGQKVGENVQTQLTDQENQAKGLNDTFTQDVNQQNPILSQEQIKNAASNPAAFIQGEGNAQNFSDTYNKTYAGPSAPVDTSSQTNKVNELSELTKSSGGREQLLKGIYQQPEKATGGQLALDNALIQGTPSAIKSITDKQSEADRITGELGANRSSQQDAIMGAQKNISDRKMDIDSLFWQNPDSAYNTLQKAVNAKTSAAQKSASKEGQTAFDAFNLDKIKKLGNIYLDPTNIDHYETPMQKYMVDPNKLTVSKEALAQLGISKTEYADILSAINLMNSERTWAQKINADQDKSGKRDAEYDDRAQLPGLIDTQDLQAYLKNLGTTGITASNVASADDYANLSAMNQLLGEHNPQLDFKYLSTPTKAGTYKSDITNLNEKAMLDYIMNQLLQTDTDYDYGAHLGADDDYRNSRQDFVTTLKQHFNKYRTD